MADLDIVSLAEAQSITGATTSHQDLLTAWVSAISEKVDDHCGPVVSRPVTGEKHSGGCDALDLLSPPALSVTSVTESGTALTSSDYELDVATGELWRLSSDGSVSVWSGGPRQIEVSYVSGRFADTESVSEKFKRAASVALINVWQMHQGGVAQVGEFDVPRKPFPGFLLPNAAIELLADEDEAPVFT